MLAATQAELQSQLQGVLAANHVTVLAAAPRTRPSRLGTVLVLRLRPGTTGIVLILQGKPPMRRRRRAVNGTVPTLIARGRALSGVLAYPCPRTLSVSIDVPDFAMVFEDTYLGGRMRAAMTVTIVGTFEFIGARTASGSRHATRQSLSGCVCTSSHDAFRCIYRETCPR